MFETHTPVYHSTLGSRVIEKSTTRALASSRGGLVLPSVLTCGTLRQMCRPGSTAASHLRHAYAESVGRRRADIAHLRQARPDSGLGFVVNVLKTF